MNFVDFFKSCAVVMYVYITIDPIKMVCVCVGVHMQMHLFYIQETQATI